MVEQVQCGELSGGPGLLLWGLRKGSLKVGVSEQNLEGRSVGNFGAGREGIGRMNPVRQRRMLCSFVLLPSLAGEAVSVVGFGVFGQACGPSVTSGILSAVVQVDDTPVMLQTTCAVHGGSSGGPLFSTSSGDLLGKQLLGPFPGFPLPEPQSLASGWCPPPAGKMVSLCPGSS